MDDRTLLQRYAETQCEQAFATLVARHIDHVHSVAYRDCANPHQAQKLITFPNLCAPKPGEIMELPDSHLVNEVSVDVAVIGDTERKRLSLVGVRDDQGRAVPFDDKHSLYDRNEGVFGFQAKPDVRSLSFTFAVHDSRFVEFRAKPIQVSAVAHK